MDLDVQGPVVDADAPVAPVGDRREVADHVRLEIAGRGLHRRLLGPVDRGEGRRVDALPPLERGQLLLPGGQALGLPGDLLGVDGVGLDPGSGVGLVVTGAPERVLRVADLDLEALARPRLLGDRSERIERAGLLFDLERGGVAQRGQRLARLLADEAVELSLESLDLGDMGFLAAEQVLRLGQVRQPERARAAAPGRLRSGAARPPSRSGRATAGRSRRLAAGSASCRCVAATRRRRRRQGR